jgi:SAM-dependent methyltransferase
MSISPDAAPLCPVTGKPAVRRVQWVTTRLLIDLWRVAFNVDARGSFAGIERFGLWESPTGLYFFDPPAEGDHGFYSDLYAGLKRRRLLTPKRAREEFSIAARHIPSGARVLDVGCGYGDFRQFVPQAVYTGLDPHFGLAAVSEGVRNETLGQHLVGRTGRYDAVCCFEVIEHVRDPKTLFTEIVQAAKPGGLVCVSAPRVPSAITRIPNFVMNAPPHHLTWWSKTALCELAKNAGAVVESVENVPWGEGPSEIYWIERCSPIKCRDIHFRGAVAWHAASLAAGALGFAASRLLRAPKMSPDQGVGLLMIARRPGGP